MGTFVSHLLLSLPELQALKRELIFMESEALRFAAALETAADTQNDPTKLTAQLEGRFRFLWGVYRAHSEVSISPAGIISLSFNGNPLTLKA